MYAKLAIESLQRFELVLQRSRNRAVNRLQNLDDTFQLLHSFFESGELFGCDNHTGFGYGGLVGLKPRVKGAAGDAGLSTDVGDAFTVLIAQDKLTFLVGGIFHRYFLLNVDMSIVTFR